jgi:hypothetical protein
MPVPFSVGGGSRRTGPAAVPALRPSCTYVAWTTTARVVGAFSLRVRGSATYAHAMPTCTPTPACTRLVPLARNLPFCLPCILPFTSAAPHLHQRLGQRGAIRRLTAGAGAWRSLCWRTGMGKRLPAYDPRTLAVLTVRGLLAATVRRCALRRDIATISSAARNMLFQPCLHRAACRVLERRHRGVVTSPCSAWTWRKTRILRVAAIHRRRLRRSLLL